jgi:hypothetical protein
LKSAFFYVNASQHTFSLFCFSTPEPFWSKAQSTDFPAPVDLFARMKTRRLPPLRSDLITHGGKL